MNQYDVPKYITLKNNIIKNINEQIYSCGQMIPSERELIELFNMSRITVRKAISDLVNEGYLYKVQGKGTFVKDEKEKQDLFSLTSCTQDIIKLGKTPSRKVITSKVVDADNKVCEKLNIKSNDKIFILQRIYYADNEPINFTQTCLPYKYINGIESYDFSKASLYDVLESKYEIKITHATRTVQAVVANDVICNYLEIKKGDPLLLFNCVTYGIVNSKTIPIEAFRCYYRSDHFSFFINQIK